MLALMVDCALIGTLAFLGLAVWRLGTVVEHAAVLEGGGWCEKQTWQALPRDGSTPAAREEGP